MTLLQNIILVRNACMKKDQRNRCMRGSMQYIRTYINSHTCPTVDPKRIDSAEQLSKWQWSRGRTWGFTGVLTAMLTGILAEAIPGAITKETKYQAIPCIYLSFKHGWHDLHAIRAGGGSWCPSKPMHIQASLSNDFLRAIQNASTNVIEAQKTMQIELKSRRLRT